MRRRSFPRSFHRFGETNYFENTSNLASFREIQQKKKQTASQRFTPQRVKQKKKYIYIYLIFPPIYLIVIMSEFWIIYIIIYYTYNSVKCNYETCVFVPPLLGNGCFRYFCARSDWQKEYGRMGFWLSNGYQLPLRETCWFFRSWGCSKKS